METSIPSTYNAIGTLLRADLTTQWRNRRAVMLTLLVPVIILIFWKSIIKYYGGAFALSNSITVGLVASGLMGYTNSIARDRDKGIFQRLRVAPIPSWSIMASRLFVQLLMIIIITTAVFITGYFYDNIRLTTNGYILTYVTATIGGLIYLSLGQMIVALNTNPETVNSTTRLIYFVFIMVGMLSEFKVFPKIIHDFVRWSPYGTTKIILAAAMGPGKWSNDTTNVLLVTIGYITIFTFFGLKWFKWNTK